MEIHELNTFSGTLGSGDFFATDNGTDTSKVSAESLLAPLNTRIDNIIAGPAPSAEEIVDARLGIDGVTYNSLGNAIRGQVSDLRTDLNDIFSLSSAGWAIGSLNSGTGAEVGNTARIRSPYIEAGDISTVLYMGDSDCLIVYEFAADKSYLADSAWTDGNKFSITNASTKYIRILVRKSSSNPNITSSEIAGLVAGLQIFRKVPASVYSIDSTLADIDNEFEEHKAYQRAGINYLNPSLLTDGKYYASANTKASAAGYATFEADIPKGTYYIKNLYGAFTFIIIGGTSTKLQDMPGMVSGWNTGTITLDNDCTIHGTGKPSTDLNYSGLATNYPVRFAPLGIYGTSDIVEVGVGKEFTGVKDAVEYAENFHDLTVKFYSGTYDLIEEYGTVALNLISGTAGLNLCNNNKYLFSPNARVKFNYTGGNANVNRYFAPFQQKPSVSGGFTLIGLNLECSNVKYAIHDELSGADVTSRTVIKDCKFYLDNRNNTVWPHQQIIGGGLSKNSNISIEGCYFESAGTAGMVTYHNGVSADCLGYIVFKDNYLSGVGRFEAHYYGESTDVTQCIVTNNSMGREPAVIQESSSYSNVNMAITAWNNEIRA